MIIKIEKDLKKIIESESRVEQFGFYFAYIFDINIFKSFPDIYNDILFNSIKIAEFNDKIALLKFDIDKEKNYSAEIFFGTGNSTECKFVAEGSKTKGVNGFNFIIKGSFESCIIRNSILFNMVDKVSNSNIEWTFAYDLKAKDSCIAHSLIRSADIKETEVMFSIISFSDVDYSCKSKLLYNNFSFDTKSLVITTLNICGFQSKPCLKSFADTIDRIFNRNTIQAYQEASNGINNLITTKAGVILESERDSFDAFQYTDIAVYNIHAKATKFDSKEFVPHVYEIIAKDRQKELDSVFIGDFNNNTILQEISSKCKIHKYGASNALEDVIVNDLNKFKNPVFICVPIATLDKNHKLGIFITYCEDEEGFEIYNRTPNRFGIKQEFNSTSILDSIGVEETIEKSCDDCIYDSNCPEEELGPRPFASECTRFERINYE